MTREPRRVGGGGVLPDVGAVASGGDDPRVDRHVEWMHDASNPYWDWLWGTPCEGERRLRAWLARPSSELSVQRLVEWIQDGRAVGGYIAVGGRDLAAHRRADLIAIMNHLRSSGEAMVSARLRQANRLFLPVDPGVLYLSRMGVVQSARGRHVGSRLLAAFLERGRSQGFTRFRLDVSAGNEAAVGLYRRAGFEVIAESRVQGTPVHYYAMERCL